MAFDPMLSLIADYAYNFKYEMLTESAIHTAKQRILDTIGCALGGFKDDACEIARKMCPDTVDRVHAHILGSYQDTSLEMAAFTNGIMSRYLDFNDTYRAVDAAHPSDTIAPLLAVCEAYHKTGKDMIAAVVLSYEISCRFLENAVFDRRGFDQPTYIILGNTLAVGWLLGLSRDALANAAAIALASNITLYQTRVGELSMWKAGAAAMCARQGIFCALLAKAGMTGPEQIFDGQYGLFNAVTGTPFSLEPMGGKGVQFAIERTNMKTYPVRDSIQQQITTALELREKIDINEIESIYLETYKSNYNNAVAPKQLWAPKFRETADHSVPFSVAVALCDGDVTPETFTKKRFLDKDVLDMIGRMKIEAIDEFTKETPGRRNCRITATLKNGEKITVHRVLQHGDADDYPDSKLSKKFLGLAEVILSKEASQKLLDTLWSVENVTDMFDVVDMTRF